MAGHNPADPVESRQGQLSHPCPVALCQTNACFKAATLIVAKVEKVSEIA